MAIKSYISNMIKELISFFKLFLPKGKTETTLLITLSIIYLSYSIILIFQTSIIDHPTIETDLYFSFDNPLILKYGRTQISGHPLIMLFYYPLVLIGNGLAMLIGLKAKTVFFVLLCSFFISMSSVYIYRYLNKIVEIESRISLFITLFFSFFSTNLILSFTPESFTLSIFFLSFNVYYFSAYIKKEIFPPLIPSIILSSVMLGGVTITNFAKGVIPILFARSSITSIIKRGIVLGVSFIAILCVIHLASYYILDKDFLGSILAHREYYTSGTLSPGLFFDRVFCHFWGAPIFFSELASNAFYNPAYDHWGKMISEEGYDKWWQYLFTFSLLIMIIVSVIKNYKNRLMWMVVFLLAVDITIHVVFRFGIITPFIYGSHWIYCIPLLLGWLYKSLTPKYANIFLISLGCMFLGLIINNGAQLSNFIEIAIELFPINP